MKLIFASLLFGATISIMNSAPNNDPSSSTLSIYQSLISNSASLFQLPEAKGRTGSKRVGGYTNKGKGSHYIGGRK
jgi:hypothetical protein